MSRSEAGTARALPLPDDETRFFWEGAREGKLLILRCAACGVHVHPPRARCRSCGSASQAPSEMSGRGVIHSFTVTHRSVAGLEPPFVVALVELEEQPGLRLVTNIVGMSPDEVAIGMAVRVTFERITDEITLPVFSPRGDP